MEPWIASLILSIALALVASWFLAPVAWAKLLLGLARVAAGMRSRSTDVDGIRWHYLEGGQGPVLVMVHGFGATADHWLRIAWRLRKRFRVIAPDLVGFGTSDSGDNLPFDAASQASRLGDLLLALGVRDCLLLGSSMGGWIATALAAAEPGRVRALWLQAPLGVKEGDSSPFLAEADRRNGLAPLHSRKDYEYHVVRHMFVKRPWIPYPLRVYYGNDAVRRIEAAQRMFLEVRHDSAPLEELAGQVAAPVLLQWGDEDRVVDVSGADVLARSFPDVEVRIQPRTGHLPMLETPGQSLHFFLDFHRRRFPVAGNGPRQNRGSGGL